MKKATMYDYTFMEDGRIYSPRGFLIKESPGLHIRGKDGKMIVAKMRARATYEAFHGEVPKSHIVIHKDGDKENYALDNLEAVFRSDYFNSQTEYKERFYRYTEEQVEELRQRYLKGEGSIRSMAKKYGMGISTMAKIANGTYFSPNKNPIKRKKEVSCEENA